MHLGTNGFGTYWLCTAELNHGNNLPRGEVFVLQVVVPEHVLPASDSQCLLVVVRPNGANKECTVFKRQSVFSLFANPFKLSKPRPVIKVVDLGHIDALVLSSPVLNQLFTRITGNGVELLLELRILRHGVRQLLTKGT